MTTTKQDKLTVERLRERLHYDAGTGVFTRRVGSGHARAGDMAGSVHRTGYVRISIDGGEVYCPSPCVALCARRLAV